MKVKNQKSIIAFWGVLIILIFSPEKVFPQSEGHAKSNGYVSSYHSPLDLVSKITMPDFSSTQSEYKQEAPELFQIVGQDVEITLEKNGI